MLEDQVGGLLACEGTRLDFKGRIDIPPSMYLAREHLSGKVQLLYGLNYETVSHNLVKVSLALCCAPIGSK